MLRLSDPHVLQGGPPLGAMSRETSQVFQNARMSGVLNAAGTSDDFLGLNLNSPASGDDAYGARISLTAAGWPYLKSWTSYRYLPLGVIPQNRAASHCFPISPEATFFSSTLLTMCWNAHMFDQQGGNECCTCAHVDDDGIGGPPLGPGQAGISAVRMAGTLDGTFDNLSVVTIPEPTAFMLAAIGLGVLRLRRIRTARSDRPSRLKVNLAGPTA